MTTSELKYDTWMAQTVLFQQQWLKCNLIVGRFSLLLTGQLVNNLFPLGVFSLCSRDISHELINMQWGGYGTGEQELLYDSVVVCVWICQRGVYMNSVPCTLSGPNQTEAMIHCYTYIHFSFSHKPPAPVFPVLLSVYLEVLKVPV